jgi:hypothetical protein
LFFPFSISVGRRSGCQPVLFLSGMVAPEPRLINEYHPSKAGDCPVNRCPRQPRLGATSQDTITFDYYFSELKEDASHDFGA